MQIYLPIAELSVNVFLLFGMGAAVGFLSGLFGVGGGFLMTPLLIFAGVPPAVAVGSAAHQLVASSVSAMLAHLRRGSVDVVMGGVMTLGGVLGSGLGSWIFALLKKAGQVDLAISLCFVVFLGGIGGIMLYESGMVMLRGRDGTPPPRRKLHQHGWVHGLPLKMRFRKSRLYISALLPAGIGFAVGLLAAIMGVGGGFIMVPAMIYILGMPTQMVIGTSLMQISIVTAVVTFLHALNTQTVDVVLAIVLLTGSVIGAQFGVRAGLGLKGEHLRGLLGLLVVAVAGRLAWGLVATPDELFTLTTLALP
jgi:uncharacterized membrane protein YfcA